MHQCAKIHPVKLVAAQDQIIIERTLEEITHVLTDGVGSSLIPLRASGSLLCGKDVHKAAREIVELVTVLNMSMQRHAVELRQHIDRAQHGVQTIADRDIDDAIFATERHGWFGAVLRQREQTGACAAAHDNSERLLCCIGWQRSERFGGRTFWKRIALRMVLHCPSINNSATAFLR